MRIIRNYILRESLIPFILSLVVLTSVFLLGNLIQLTNLVINKGVSLATIGQVFLLYVPVLLGYTIPIASLVGVILAFSRLSSDNEILALRASGIHILRLLFPIAYIGIILSLFSIVLNERIIPYAHHEQQKLLKNLGSNNPTALLEAGVFINAFQDQVLFIHRIEDNKMYNITIYQPQPNGPTRTIIAKEGEFTPIPGTDEIKLKLMNGTSDEPSKDNPKNFYKLNFTNFFMTLDLSKNKEKLEKKPKSMTLGELTQRIKELKKLKASTDPATNPKKLNEDLAIFITEFHRKISWSFSPLIFMLFGFPLAVITNKRERSANIILAVICAAVYYLLSLGCEALSVQELVNPAFVMWAPNAIGLIAATILNIKCAS